MQKIFASRVATSIIFFVVGALIGGQLTRHHESKNVPAQILTPPPPPPGLSIAQDADKFFDDIFNEDYFQNSRKPFEEMQRIEKDFLQRYSQAELLQNDFNKWYQKKFGGGDVGDVKQKEDDDYDYFYVSLKGDAPKNLKIGIKDKQIHLTPETESKDLTDKFERNFPIPSNVDTARYKIEKGIDELVIMFPKQKNNRNAHYSP